MRLIATILFTCFAALTALYADELTLPAIFSDHMVLQRDRAVPVWGEAKPGEQVIVEFAGQKKTATADASGKWQVKLDPLKASAEPRELKVGPKVIQDVLVGEVWLGSGQSNMAFPMRGKNAESLPTLDFPTLRFFNLVERPINPVTGLTADTAKPQRQGAWHVCSQKLTPSCSAVLFYFGRSLQENLDGVPVGLINASAGGTSIRLWMDRDLQMANPDLRAAVERDEQKHAEFDMEKAEKMYHASKGYKAWQEAAEKAKAEGKKVPRRQHTALDTHRLWLPAGSWFQSRVAPLIPFGIRGVVWYQGEADGKTENGLLYRQQLPALIRDWRTRWGDPDLPFAWVQLPLWNAVATEWPAIRESQLKTLALPHTGMAVTFDVGNPNSVHPIQKKPVGERLAQWALGDVYGQAVETSGPLPSGHEIRGSEFHVRFRHADGMTGKGGAVKGFTLAGADQQWYPATSRIKGDTIVVSTPEVPAPVALRYAWDANPENANLYNSTGLPASPFRTDDWELKK
jgi:sialate O-acetylesterase